MKIIVGGCGGVGSSIIDYLSKEEKHDITVIDIDKEAIKTVLDNYAVSGIVGNLTSIEVLENSGIKDCDIFIATTPDDEVNMLSCQLASIYNTPVKIAMLDNSEYSTNAWQDIFIFKKIAIDKVIAPTSDLIVEMRKRLEYSHLDIIDLYSVADDKIKIFSVFYAKDNTYIIGNTVQEVQLNAEKNYINLKIIFIVRNGKEFIPSDNDELEVNDKIYISTDTNSVTEAYLWFCNLEISEHELLQYQNPNIVIAGNNPIIKDVSITLKQYFNKIKVVSTCHFETLPIELEKYKIEYIQDDIKSSTYSSNYLSSNNVIIVINNTDEDTALTSLLLQNQGLGTIFCWLDSTLYQKLLIKNNIRHIFTLNEYIMPKILTTLRRGVIYEIFSLYNKAEIIDFELSEASKAIGLSVESIENKNNIKVISVLDDKDMIINFSENTILAKNYRVIIISSRQYISETENIFSQAVKL